MAMDAGLWSPRRPHADSRLRADEEDSCPIRRCQNGRRVTPLLGDAKNTIFISKIFPQKIWPKNWGGSSNRKFREWFCVRVRSCSTRPPFRADEKHRGSFFPPAFRQRSGGARQQFRLLGAESICRSFAHYLQPQPSSRRIVCHISATLDPVTRTHAR